MDRGFYHLPDTGNDRHHRDVDVSAGHGKHTVAADADQAVGELHDKSGSSQADDIGCAGSAVPDLFRGQKPDFEFRFFTKEIQNKGS